LSSTGQLAIGLAMEPGLTPSSLAFSLPWRTRHFFFHHDGRRNAPTWRPDRIGSYGDNPFAGYRHHPSHHKPCLPARSMKSGRRLSCKPRLRFVGNRKIQARQHARQNPHPWKPSLHIGCKYPYHEDRHRTRPSSRSMLDTVCRFRKCSGGNSIAHTFKDFPDGVTSPAFPA